MRALFARQYRWQCWLDVEAALAAAEAECGVIPVAAAEAIASAARLAGLDVARIQRGIAETSHPLMALVTELAADAVAAVAAAAAAAARVPGVGTVARWQLAAAVTCGLLLAPAWPARVANTSWLWAAPR